MGLADDLLAPADARGGSSCAVAAVLDVLEASDPDAHAALLTVLDLPIEAMPSTVISKRLKAAGINLGHTSLQRHRRKDCKCPT